MLREVGSVAGSEEASEHVRTKFERAWAEQHIGLPLELNFRHDYVLVLDGNDQLLMGMSPRRPVDAAWFSEARTDLTGLLAYMRGRGANLPSAIVPDEASTTMGGAHPYAAVISNS